MKQCANITDSVGVVVVKKPIKCSKCKEWRIQVARCENCGNEKPFEEEKNAQAS